MQGVFGTVLSTSFTTISFANWRALLNFEPHSHYSLIKSNIDQSEDSLFLNESEKSHCSCVFLKSQYVQRELEYIPRLAAQSHSNDTKNKTLTSHDKHLLNEVIS